jgi:rRNA maturation endonuclease Nob1
MFVPSAKRRAIDFRVYCFACGRATEVEIAPMFPGRCRACGGSLIVENQSSVY